MRAEVSWRRPKQSYIFMAKIAKTKPVAGRCSTETAVKQKLFCALEASDARRQGDAIMERIEIEVFVQKHNYLLGSLRNCIALISDSSNCIL